MKRILLVAMTAGLSLPALSQSTAATAQADAGVNPSAVYSQVGAVGPYSNPMACQEMPSSHVYNGFDYALAKAKNSALVDCAHKGFASPREVTYQNLGLTAIGTELFCEVRFWYRCQ